MSPSLDPILKQTNPVHTFTHIFQIHFNIIIVSVPTSPKLSLPFERVDWLLSVVNYSLHS